MEKKTKESKWWNSFWKWLGDYLLTVFKNEAVKTLFKLIFNTTKMAGFKLWLTQVIVDVLWDYLGEPLAKLAIRKGLLVYDKANGEIRYKKLLRAKVNNNEDDYNDAIDDV